MDYWGYAETTLIPYGPVENAIKIPFHGKKQENSTITWTMSLVEL